VNGPADTSRIYLLSEGERQVSPDGPAVVGPDGVRQDIPPLVFKAVMHVIEAMRAGKAVKVTPLRPELPVDEAAAAIGMDALDFRSYVSDGEIPFRSSEYVDWVRLQDVLDFDRRLSEQRRGAIQELLDEPWDEDEHD
jgi:hypothetical protein